jgi:hypothetical protein
MARDLEGQLSFDWSKSTSPRLDARPSESAEAQPSANVFSLKDHRIRQEEAERAYYFSQILKLVSHLST